MQPPGRVIEEFVEPLASFPPEKEARSLAASLALEEGAEPPRRATNDRDRPRRGNWKRDSSRGASSHLKDREMSKGGSFSLFSGSPVPHEQWAAGGYARDPEGHPSEKPGSGEVVVLVFG
jgi:hypothetical protein